MTLRDRLYWFLWNGPQTRFLWYRRVLAKAIGAHLCARCEDSRGGAVGNGQWVNGEVLCDYCNADVLRGVKYD